jgi:ABC-type multidrug transport system ATPase subunit
MTNPVVEVKSLVKQYKNLTAVDNISFQVYEGEIFAFLGPNGAGKTTTVEILDGGRTCSRLYSGWRSCYAVERKVAPKT